MAIISVTPDDITAKLDQIGPGTEIVLQPGRYREVLRLTGKRGTAEAPIVLRGEPGTVITDETAAEDFRRKGNELAKSVEDRGDYPGLYPWMLNGRLRLERCRHVRIQDLTFEKSWPTHVAVQSCQNIALVRCRFRDATFAVGAEGAATYGITIEDCDWTQDRPAHRLWQEIPWWRVHGRFEDGRPTVDVAHDWRLFDGDFFRGDGIRGGVTIKDCRVSQAFNAIHLFNGHKDPELALDVNVHGCRFFEIRDNVIEPETVAQNWWFWNNDIYNGHKWFSLECERSRFMYLFGNRGWFDSVQGPPGLDSHRGGGVFKFDKKADRVFGPHYIFHNSISTRSDYARKGSLPGMQHFNNAIRMIQPNDKMFDETPHFFGNLSVPRDRPGSVGERFVTTWNEHDIEWYNDVVAYAAWPQLLRDHGYPIGDSGPGSDPGFRAPFAGDLRLTLDSPCRGASVGADLQMPDGGEPWRLPAGQHIGAWQDDGVIKGPAYRPIADPRRGFEPLA
jgi:hypothetical protein